MFGVIAASEEPIVKRKAHQKSRYGCITCKARKLKCDEVKPVCGNCKRRYVELEACNYSAGRVFPQDVTLKNIAPQPRTQLEEKRPHFNPKLPGSVSSGILDPFMCYPESRLERSDVDILMKYYLSEVVYRYYPWQPPSDTNPTTTYYVPLVWSDPVLFHAVLQLASLRLQRDGKYREITSKQSMLTAESISLLRTRVEEDNNINDETISAVATLAAIEHEKGNLGSLRMHISGLKRMIHLRGGLKVIRKNNPMVANFVFWVFVMAVYECSLPALDVTCPAFYPSQHHLVSSFSDISTMPLDSPLLSPIFTNLFEPIQSVLTSVQHVSQLVPSSSSYPSASTSLVILTRLMNLLSYLTSLPPITGPNEYSCLVSESARYAILLHVFTPWRGLPPDGTLAINHLLHRLISFLRPLLHLSRLGLEDHERQQGNVLLFWIVSVGGVAAQGLPERSWFVGILRDMCDERDVNLWEDWKAIVEGVIWHDRLCTPLHKKLWAEVGKLQDMEEDRKV